MFSLHKIITIIFLAIFSTGCTAPKKPTPRAEPVTVKKIETLEEIEKRKQEKAKYRARVEAEAANILKKEKEKEAKKGPLLKEYAKWTLMSEQTYRNKQRQAYNQAVANRNKTLKALNDLGVDSQERVDALVEAKQEAYWTSN